MSLFLLFLSIAVISFSCSYCFTRYVMRLDDAERLSELKELKRRWRLK